jgi:hypothetical protein
LAGGSGLTDQPAALVDAFDLLDHWLAEENGNGEAS